MKYLTTYEGFQIPDNFSPNLIEEILIERGIDNNVNNIDWFVNEIRLIKQTQRNQLSITL